ncbi:imidazoleglycerol-phosphate dehydratase HisB [Clostridium tagluense]|uniref:imidazoleglycerol-phosphate dehydratase HisB n=1 Tax=Clostridium tagluense TaxID=360422 RepID=UPI001C0DC56C|nr:imidazoleglycerol-phosphate dehydratase HisB [Clostridium tagluense]MBU3130228.1 imidazoleglycerol-phosphate dehydratase HisB [Clostridium tagluense]MBW9159060.1 imidazoleglycerol-phosphate dehydratase HisB [Clostridium tagluense]MCB2313850.1 imidazoleglycerol-phosphate dehydratase HisB [Clostridium tagluense]MCB2323542.1 imidazoleglycerol-phosphate dehydratase HisB [Clostridium tagluense]MCB2328411.1 imidazoleglycerol-phosphate dehydratase HisB [Clostridium tagluense]
MYVISRQAKIERESSETKIDISINLDGSGKYECNTGIGFFDHMLCLFAKHGLLDLYVAVAGDLNVDSHHTIEDVGIVLGSVIKEAMKGKDGIKRYGTSFVPMDETLATVSLDLSGRAYLVFEGDFTVDLIGSFDTEMVEEFFRAVAVNAGITLHARVLYGKNNHHMVEALFKAFGKALSEALTYDDRIKGVLSTKGCL